MDPAKLDMIQDALVRADLGYDLAHRVTTVISQGVYSQGITPDEVKAVVAAEVAKILEPVAKPLVIGDAKPFVILVAGVNGSGKTTTIGKLASKLSAEGRKVVLAAGDTFRAAAIDQLKIWGQRTGAKVIAREQGSDSASLAFEALSAAKSEGADVLIVDTAGRLQNRAELMGELEKMVRVMKKLDAERAARRAARARRHRRPERAVAGRGVRQDRRRHRPRHDQARRHRARRHPRFHRREVQTADPFHRRRRRHRRSRAVRGEGFRPGARGTRVTPWTPAPKLLIEAPITPTLLRLAIPNVITTVVQASTGLIETYFIGKLGTDALAGVALVFPGVMLMQMMSAGAMGGGVSSAIARALGAGRREDADATISHALIIAAGFALFFTVTVIAAGPWLYSALGGRGARSRSR